MKKAILFCLLIGVPTFAHASLIQEFEVLNGELSRKFDSNNNYYSVDLNEGEDTMEYTYKLANEQDTIEESKEKDKVILTVSSDTEKEKYVFYINQKEAKKVMKEIKEEKEEQRIIPHLKYYVGGGCLLSILILFKIIVIGFKK